MHSRLAQRLRGLMVWTVLLGVAGGAHAQLASKVKDINTTRLRTLDSPFMPDLATVGTTTFFAFDDGGTGLELWKLNGITGSAELVKDICPGSCPSVPLSLTAVGGTVFFKARDGVHGFELWKSDGTEAGTAMVRDIDPGNTVESYWPILNVGGTLYFAANDRVHGAELWASDGTAAGTRLVADLNPGPASSNPIPQASSQGRFLFTASDASSGSEPWISDGTAGGTYRLRDLNPGLASSIGFAYTFNGDETALGLSDGSFLFAANDGAHGEELWRTDGTDAGTVLLKDINPGSAGSAPTSFALLNGKAYFQAATQDLGTELWATDGTAAGTALVKDITAGTNSSYPERLTVLNGRLFFTASSRQFWSSDGTAAGTEFLASGELVASGTLGGSVLALTADPFSRTDLRVWQTNGTPAGTVQIKNLGLQETPCYNTSRPDPALVNGALFFYNCRRGFGPELWKTDGTSTGTVSVQSLARTPSFPMSYSGSNSFLIPFGNRLFFSADDGVAGTQLWSTDGSPAATAPIPGVTPGTWPSYLDSPVQVGDALIANGSSGLMRIEASGTASQIGPTFTFSPSQRLGNQILAISGSWVTGLDLPKTDGTAAGTGLVKTLYTGSTSQSPGFLGQAGSLLFFKADGDHLWRTDGTGAGTFLLRDLRPTVSSTINYPAVLGNALFFFAIDDTQLWGLWKTDGTVAGTVKVKPFDQGPSVFGAAITGITQAAGRMFIKVDDGTHGNEPWVSDGTAAGTHLLKDVRPGTGSSGADWLFSSGQAFYFLADDGTHGRELWVTDGTEAGTRLVKDVWPGTESSGAELFLLSGQGSLYFVADDGTHGRELWVSDGTGAGTRLLKDIRPGAESSGIPPFLVAVQSRYFFTADDGLHGTELWVTDGTEAGTRMVNDVWPGPESSLPSNLVAVGRTLAFTASNGVHGAEPWVTSGTETGTFLLQDLAPGAQSSGPFSYTVAPPSVYFVADDGTSGTELWKTTKAAMEPTFDDVHSTYWAWPYVEALVTNGLTTGCGGGLYCPTRPVTRAEMAVFMLRIIHGNTYVPPDVAVSRFADVPASHWALDWIEQLAAENITSGCGVSPPLYCPESSTARDQMAVFLLRALHGASYTPPPATGTRFTDVPATYWAAAWIEQLAAEGITSGCAPNLYCPGDPVSRDQMAVFLTRALNLPLP